MFCSEDDWLRPFCHKPFYPESEPSRLMATNSIMMLLVDKSIVSGKYDTQKMKVPRFRNDSLNKTVRFEDIEAAYNRFALIPEMVAADGKDDECPECDGSGTVEYEYTCDTTGRTYYHEDDCPVCEGSGKRDVEMVPTGRMLLPPKTFFCMEGVVFKAELLWKAVEGLRLMGFESFVWQTAASNTANVFDVAEGITFVIMPSHIAQGETGYDVEVIKIS